MNKSNPYATCTPEMARWLDPDGTLQAAGLLVVEIPHADDYDDGPYDPTRVGGLYEPLE